MTRAAFVAFDFIAFAAGSTGHAAAGGTLPMVITFEDLEVGQSPNGFTTALTGGGGAASWACQRPCATLFDVEDTTFAGPGKVSTFRLHLKGTHLE